MNDRRRVIIGQQDMDKLRIRWKGAEAAKYGKWLGGCPLSGRRKVSPDHSGPFGMTSDGKVDLRGIDFSDIENLKCCDCVSSDFSMSRLGGHWISHCSFDDCTFAGADLKQLADHGNSFSHCSFSGTDLTGAGIGYEGSKYSRCVFDSTRFAKAIFSRPEFDECIFDRCKFDGVDFNGSSFVSCRFSGRLESVWFRGELSNGRDLRQLRKARKNSMTNVSFENARLLDVTFANGCSLESVIIPAEPGYLKLDSWESRLAKLEARIKDFPEELRLDAAVVLLAYKNNVEGQDWNILYIDDIREIVSGGKLSAAQVQTLTADIWKFLQDG